MGQRGLGLSQGELTRAEIELRIVLTGKDLLKTFKVLKTLKVSDCPTC